MELSHYRWTHDLWDWESALWGIRCGDLSTHIHAMHYTDAELGRFLDEATNRLSAATSAGIAADLTHTDTSNA